MSVKAMPVFGFGKESASSGSILILIVTSIIIAGALINIFNYKARKKQLWITIGLIVLSLLNILLYARASGVPPFTEGQYNLTALLALAIPIFLIMAAGGISRDQKLVKSTDRLR
jgi:peptidoglycan/LPS O-acetylase OafA/YrhL